MRTNVKELLCIGVVALLVGTVLLPIQAVPSQASNVPRPSTLKADAQYWALIVGVGIYADDQEANRPDMILEANDFRNLLLQSPWWSADHIRLLTADNATRSNIMAGFRWLQKNAGADDVVVVYLSTHGNFLPFDLPPRDEADNADEILATYWGFAYNTTFINDDTLNIQLNQLKSNNVCLIVDSCYAGGFNDHWRLLKSVPEQHRVILMGSCEDELSYSGGFAPYLIDGFRGYADVNGDGLVTAEEAFNYSEPRAEPRQTPTIYDGYPGELPLTTNLVQRTKTSSSSSSFLQEHPSTPSPQTVGSRAETAVICGYVNNSGGEPVVNALVTVSGRIDYQQTYTNTTTTDTTGFYFMHAPALRVRVTVSAQGYCDMTSYQFTVHENNTYWRNFTLVPRPTETATIRGYITSAQNSTPLSANVSLRWTDSQGNTYQNTTASDGSGYYQMNVAPGQVDLDFTKDGYFSASRDNMNITDGQILWVNVSLNPFPAETAMVSGYITDSDTGAPLVGVRIDIMWVDIANGHEYSRGAQTNASGFFSTQMAPGELYIDVRANGYSYYDPYRHDTVDGKTLWMNLSLQRDSVSVYIAKPLRALYLNNQRITPWSSTRIIGPIEIKATSLDFDYGPGGGQWQVQKVEFYIDGNLKATATAEPYMYNWTAKTFGKHTIKVVAYGFHNDTASQEIEVSKFL
jgi:hypothetical protein